ncbi:hypothetical protein CHLNCDRAFT_144710 [Chlorella variabilis]|uniref:magnesium-protoporphyrin IX monomethyl ester (oxidative) cyclase n=1 Tax=Chlorella variabilis TaxID=554065 RepID=E1ZCV1_CHLVA|nr:hypothetical protein CHLNCDRAFT_144710 [Chlorella variabilis]EFN56111.1 hypothetical protein CHLNCDRAFT_144710 [Chlorella variabilis]|eukprot:XP_005848213.1 hypothetical protein CHLNCDRAFT_144710 [Chlorella variabilis]
MQAALNARFGVARPATRAAGAHRSAVQPVRAAAATEKEMTDDLGFKLMRRGVKVAAKESILTPRFYTTDFDEVDDIFNLEKNPNLPMEELTAMLEEFRKDYNQKHFVRNDGFHDAADEIQGPMRKIFIEFLERFCTAEFFGFLLYKELGRRLQKSNPVVAEIFTLARDEARHAGFVNKALSDFNLALDLGFLTKNRTYTFFKPKFIIYATYLPEKIGYWRYISMYRHLQRNPDNQLYPMFEYLENWCQDENRHGDFLTRSLWSRFFCLSVYITMYLNDHSRSVFFGALGLNTTQFNRHVIIETNNATARVFPEVPDCDAPGFWDVMDRMVGYNEKLIAIDRSEAPEFLEKLPYTERILVGCLQLFFMPTLRSGSFDIEGAGSYQY